MFENLLSTMKQKFQESADRKAQDKEEIRKIQRDIDFESKRIFQEEYAKHAREIAIGNAKRDAAKASGIQKLRHQNRLRNLQSNTQAPGSLFSRMAEYTQKNLAKTEERKKRTAALREDAKNLKEQNVGGTIGQRPIMNRPFGR